MYQYFFTLYQIVTASVTTLLMHYVVCKVK